jgi:pSer/pThr/pTyr-binding forkhead associated (FHA) protein
MNHDAQTAYGPPRMWLTVLDQGQPSMTVEVQGTRFTIGREPDSDLVLDDPKVSRHHAAISPSAGPTRLVHDLGSANGTLVNGAAIKPQVGFGRSEERVAEIAGGEVLQFGDTIVVATLADPRNVAPTAGPDDGPPVG